MTSELKASICIPTFGRDRVLLETIEALLPLVDRDTMELLVADQTPEHDAETDARLREWDSAGALRWIRLQRPSVTAAQNFFLQEMRGEILFLFDDDVIPAPDVLQRHLRWYEDESIISVAGEAYQWTGGPGSPSVERRESGTFRHFGHLQGPVDVDYVLGCNCSMRREAAIRAGGFDELFVGAAWCWEQDLGHRMTRSGGRIVFDPTAWVIHLRHATGGCRDRSWREWQWTAGFVLYLFRHGPAPHGLEKRIFRVLRQGPLRKQNLLNPLRWPAAWVGLLGSIHYGWKNRNRISSPFVNR